MQDWTYIRAIGRRLRAERQRCGHGLFCLAEDAGLGPEVLLNIEQGDRPPSVAELVALARAMACSIEALLPDTTLRVRIQDAITV